VALYSRGARLWAMTERGRASVVRRADALAIGPSALRWDGDALEIEIDEIANPLPRRVLGRVRVHPQGLSRYSAALDDGGRHRWGPIAPCARIEVELHAPALRWQGQAYFDSNEGDEAIAAPFERWDWLRAPLADGSTAVIYDVQQKHAAADRLIATRFTPDGSAEPFDVGPRQALAHSAWRVQRAARCDPGGAAPRIVQTLEDTPFYARSLLQSSWCGERVMAVHESLSIPRLDSALVRLMLPCRMPRRA
jgi:carotenoid 1,2-hydratase